MPTTSELIRINQEAPKTRAAIKEELDIAPSSYADAEGYLSRFVRTPNAVSHDFGEIDRETARAIGKRPGPIRVELGDSSSGLIGIIKDSRSAEVLASGYDSMSYFIWRTAAGYTQIRDAADGGALLVVKGRSRDSRFAVLKVKVGFNGSCWVVTEAFLARQPYLESKRVLWERSDGEARSVPVAPSVTPRDKAEDGSEVAIMEVAAPPTAADVDMWLSFISGAETFRDVVDILSELFSIPEAKLGNLHE